MRDKESIAKALNEYNEVMGFLNAYRTYDSDDEENFPYLEIEISRIISTKLDKGEYSNPPPPPEPVKMIDEDNIYRKAILKVNGIEEQKQKEKNPEEIKVISKEMIDKLRPRACSTYFAMAMKSQGSIKLHYTSPFSSPRSDYSGSEVSENDFESDYETETVDEY